MPQGTQALYHAASKTIRCIECPDESSSAGAPLLDFGIAGGSAQREYERRVAQREARVRGMLGRRLGGVVLAITDEPQSTRAWATGARGEREFEAALADLADVVVLNDRRVPGTRGNIDHLVVGPAGLFVVDAKRYKGSLKIRDKGGLFRTDERLYVGGRDRSHLADNIGWQVQAVETLLASVGVVMPVTPVLCFIGVEWPLFFAPESFRGVRLEGPKSIRRLVTAPPILNGAEIEETARILATGFPPK
jgi:hypothetical protein